MLCVLCTRTRKLRIHLANRRITFVASRTQLGIPQNPSPLNVRLVSSSPFLTVAEQQDDEKQELSTGPYLVNSCGMSLESAELVSKKVNLGNTERPDKVIALLREYGFTDVHISKIIRGDPRVLFYQPEKTILPKLEFLCSLGVSRSDLGGMVSGNQNLIFRSLEQHLIPCCSTLRSILSTDEEVVKALKRSSPMVMNHLQMNLPVNVSLLTRLGMPKSLVCFLVSNKPRLACLQPHKFIKDVKKLIEIGFDPSSYIFIGAFQVVSLMKQTTLEQKVAVYGSWGLSEDEIWSAFKRFPGCMLFSEKKISKTMDFLVNRMGLQAVDVVKSPAVLCYSLEKRIVPRCSVVRVLQLKGLINRKPSLSSVLTPSDKHFLNSFVAKYQDVKPKLSCIFSGKMNVLELDLDHEFADEA